MHGVYCESLESCLRKTRSQNELPCSFCKTAVRQTACSCGLCASTVNPQTFMHGGAARCMGVYCESSESCLRKTRSQNKLSCSFCKTAVRQPRFPAPSGMQPLSESQGGVPAAYQLPPPSEVSWSCFPRLAWNSKAAIPFSLFSTAKEINSNITPPPNPSAWFPPSCHTPAPPAAGFLKFLQFLLRLIA